MVGKLPEMRVDVAMKTCEQWVRTNQRRNGRFVGIALRARWNAACLLAERRCAASKPAAASIARADAAAMITHDGQHSKVNR